MAVIAPVDDFYSVGPQAESVASHRATKALFCALNMNLAEEKEVAPTGVLSLLGAHVRLLPGTISAGIDETRKSDLARGTQTRLDSGRLTSGQRAKLRGKLLFTSSLLAGRWGRTYVAELIRHQYRSTSAQIQPNLMADLTLRRRQIALMEPRLVQLAQRTPCVLYSDAAGCAHIAALVFAERGAYVCSTHLPSLAFFWNIAKMEAAAALLACATASQITPRDQP